MLLRCIRAENRKLHASPIWFMFFILPIISAGYGTFNYLQNLEILRDGWYSLWTQHTLFYSLFFFPCISACAAQQLQPCSPRSQAVCMCCIFCSERRFRSASPSAGIHLRS